MRRYTIWILMNWRWSWWFSCHWSCFETHWQVIYLIPGKKTHIYIPQQHLTMKLDHQRYRIVLKMTDDGQSQWYFSTQSIHQSIEEFVGHLTLLLFSVLYTFPRVLTRRICLKIKSFLSCWIHFPHSFDPNEWVQGDIVRRT